VCDPTVRLTQTLEEMYILILFYYVIFLNLQLFLNIVLKNKKIFIMDKSNKKNLKKADTPNDKISPNDDYDDYEDDGGDDKPIKSRNNCKVEYMYRAISVHTCSLFKI
jgi:hypothetical protein